MSRGFGRRGAGDGGSEQPARPELRRPDAPAARAGLTADGPAHAETAASAAASASPTGLEAARWIIEPVVKERYSAQAGTMTRSELAIKIAEVIDEVTAATKVSLDAAVRDQLKDILAESVFADIAAKQQAANGSASVKKLAAVEAVAEEPAAPCAPAAAGGKKNALASSSRASVESAKRKVQPILMDRIDVTAASQLPRPEFTRQIGEIVTEILTEHKIQLNLIEQRELVEMMVNDMLGLGPLEPLLADERVTDIMVNGPKQVYVERGGKLELTDIQFRDNRHVMNIATRIVTRIGRRVDETSPLCDARLEDGSRVNIIIPPLAIDGASISIRKFSKKRITLDVMQKQGNMSPAMATVLRIASRARLNILISGGTGSGKTTLLNALSQMIDEGERIVTIEDAAELQLQQPHVVRLETRPANIEGHGEISMRDLVKNALRMRPDRIILGEVRGPEALDMLQAMNTGHEGSMGTIHANRPREALTRLENMIGMSGINLPAKAARTQVAAAIDMIVQISRMRDGMRRITHIIEVVGMEGDVITTQDLFVYNYQGEDPDGRLRGEYVSSGLRPHFTPKASYYGLDRALMEVI
jgi:pilus assembly protein CpaF